MGPRRTYLVDFIDQNEGIRHPDSFQALAAVDET
jgi:hypothetical protein